MTTKHGGVPGKKVSVSEGGDDYVLSELKRLIAGEVGRVAVELNKKTLLAYRGVVEELAKVNQVEPVAGSERLEWINEMAKLREDIEGVRKEVRVLARKSWQRRFGLS